MLDPLAVELHQELLDLPGALLRFLVERDADLAVGRGHRLRREAGVLALDVEVADLAEVEEALVEAGPERHPAAVDVVRQVIERLQAVADRAPIDAGQELEVDVVDRLAVLEAVDQVERRAADALDRRQAQLHRPGRHLERLRAELERARVGLVRIADAKGEPARRRPVLGGEVAGVALRLAVDDEVDVALAEQDDVLRAVLGDLREAELLEHRLERSRLGRRELDELEAHQAHRVLEQISHAVLLRSRARRGFSRRARGACGSARRARRSPTRRARGWRCRHRSAFAPPWPARRG